MAVKVGWKARAAQAREEMARTGKLVLRAPALVRGAEYLIRFTLSAVLAVAEILNGCAPFGLSMVGCSGSGLGGFAALLGACFGYLAFRGLTEGLRYVAAAILIFSVSFAFYDVRAYRTVWFMPVVAAVMDAVTGVVYLSERGWFVEDLIYFSTELLLAGACVWFYRVALSPWTEKREHEGLSVRQMVCLLLLGGTLLITLAKIDLYGGISLGRLCGALAVMCLAWKGGIGVGAAVWVATGLAMDLSAAANPFYSMAYAFSGLMTGIFSRQGKLFAALTYVLSNAVAFLWTWN